MTDADRLRQAAKELEDWASATAEDFFDPGESSDVVHWRREAALLRAVADWHWPPGWESLTVDMNVHHAAEALADVILGDPLPPPNSIDNINEAYGWGAH